MESCNATTDKSIKRRSLDEYWREAQNIMIHLGFKNLLFNSENIGQCVSVLIESELSYKESKGALSTWKFKHILTECREILTKQKTNKRKLLKNSLSTHPWLDKANNMPSQQECSPEVITDVKFVIDYIETTKFLTPSQKKCFLNYYLLGMSKTKISEELNISIVRVSQILSKTLSLLKYKYGKDIDNIYG